MAKLISLIFWVNHSMLMLLKWWRPRQQPEAFTDLSQGCKIRPVVPALTILSKNLLLPNQDGLLVLDQATIIFLELRHLMTEQNLKENTIVEFET